MAAERTEIAPLLKADIDERVRIGTATYGSPLAVESPNDSLQYAYEEALDFCFYLKQELLRRAAQNDFIHSLTPEGRADRNAS